VNQPHFSKLSSAHSWKVLQHWIKKLVSKQQLKSRLHNNFSSQYTQYFHSDIHYARTVIVISEGQRSLWLQPLLNGSRISLQPLAVESDCLTVLLDNSVSHRAGVVLEELLNLSHFLHCHKARYGHLNRERNTTHTTLEFHYQNYKVVASTQLVGTSAVST